MTNVERVLFRANTLRHRRIFGALALSTLLLGACSDDEPVAYHEVITKPHQTLDDISYAECGPTLLGLGTVPRRNTLIDFNNLPSDHIEPGQTIKIPDSLCKDTNGS
jgi:hypothetical protein